MHDYIVNKSNQKKRYCIVAMIIVMITVCCILCVHEDKTNTQIVGETLIINENTTWDKDFVCHREGIIIRGSNNITITLTSNIIINNKIQIDCSNVTFEGNGYTLSVRNPGVNDNGVYVYNASAYNVLDVQDEQSNIIMNDLNIKGGSNKSAINNVSGIITLNKVTISQTGYLAINNAGTIYANECKIFNNICSSQTAAAINNRGKIKLSNCNIFNNEAKAGAGLNNEENGVAIIDATSFIENRGIELSGGAIRNSGKMYVNNAVISNNFSAGYGGGMCQIVGELYVINSTITGNVSDYGYNRGGGVCHYNTGTFKMANSIITDNYCLYSNGEIQANDIACRDNESGSFIAYNCIINDFYKTSTAMGTLDSCITGTSTTNLNGAESNIFSNYRTNVLQLLGSDITVEHEYPCIIKTNNSVAIEVPINEGGIAYTRGMYETYFNDTDINDVKISYKQDLTDASAAILCGSVSTDTAVTSYISSNTMRSKNTCGASANSNSVIPNVKVYHDYKGTLCGSSVVNVTDNGKYIEIFAVAKDRYICKGYNSVDTDKTETNITKDNKYKYSVAKEGYIKGDFAEKEVTNCINHETCGGFYNNGFCNKCSDVNSYQRPEYDVEKKVYKISNAGQLYWFSDYISTDRSINGELTNNIYVNKNVLDENKELLVCNYLSWKPIGGATNPYIGTFDGKNYFVSGLYYYNSGANNIGLFGYVDAGAVIKNVGVENSYIRAYYRVGAVVGCSYGDVINCYNNSNISAPHNDVGGVIGATTGSSVYNCYNKGIVSGASWIGGIIGSSTSNIYNCYNIGTIKGTGTYCGGIMGGGQSNNVYNCYNTGNVIGNDYVAGIYGAPDTRYDTTVNIHNSYNVGNVKGNSYVDNIVNVIKTGSITNNYYLEDRLTYTTANAIYYGEEKTLYDFTSGQVCYLLNENQIDANLDNNNQKEDIWFQNINCKANDKYPVLDNTHANVTYVANSEYEYYNYLIVDSNVDLKTTSTTYNEKAQTPVISVTCNKTNLKQDEHYAVAFYNSDGVKVDKMKNADKYTIVVTGINNVHGTVKKTYVINKSSLRNKPLIKNMSTNKVLQGLSTDMEYSSDGITYHKVTDPNMKFSPGTYYIRYSSNDNYEVTESVKIEVSDYAENIKDSKDEDISHISENDSNSNKDSKLEIDKDKIDKTPKTSDNRKLFVWIIISILCIGSICVVKVKYNKNTNFK